MRGVRKYTGTEAAGEQTGRWVLGQAGGGAATRLRRPGDSGRQGYGICQADRRQILVRFAYDVPTGSAGPERRPKVDTSAGRPLGGPVSWAGGGGGAWRGVACGLAVAGLNPTRWVKINMRGEGEKSKLTKEADQWHRVSQATDVCGYFREHAAGRMPHTCFSWWARVRVWKAEPRLEAAPP